jgi:hypothetical protein
MVRRTWANLDTVARQRLVSSGEYVLPRGEIVQSTPATTGNLWVTHFTAARTETVTSAVTGTGGSGTVAVSATHAWVGILDWDGTQYLPNAVSADDPTLWTAQFQTYETPLFAASGAGTANTGSPGFRKIAGRQYAFFVLWIGGGQAPSLPAGGGWYSDSTIEPRINAWIGSQTGPPASAYQGAWFAPDSRRFQALLKR